MSEDFIAKTKHQLANSIALLGGGANASRQPMDLLAGSLLRELIDLRRERNVLRLALDKAGDRFCQIQSLSGLGQRDALAWACAMAITEIHDVLTGAAEPEVAA